jgi:hypothetical protein
MQMQSQDSGAKGKQMKELTRRAIEKLDAALRDEKATVRTLKSRAAESEERERRQTEVHAAELGVLQKRLRAAELRSKELQVSGGGGAGASRVERRPHAVRSRPCWSVTTRRQCPLPPRPAAAMATAAGAAAWEQAPRSSSPCESSCR